jgi:hypothetical protein
MRAVAGPVGIHRPYARDDISITAGQQKQYYERFEKEVKAFLAAMNIPTELYDHMIRIPPERIKILTGDELQRYGLNENDPYDDAARTAEVARRMGISSQELIRRKAKAISECGSSNSEDVPQCYFRIIEGR